MNAPENAYRIGPLSILAAFAVLTTISVAACSDDSNAGGGGAGTVVKCAVPGDCTTLGSEYYCNSSTKQCEKKTAADAGGSKDKDTLNGFDVAQLDANGQDTGPAGDTGASDAGPADTGSTTGTPGGVCSACAGDTECKDAAKCVPLIGGSFCIKGCTQNTDCGTSGLKCLQVTNSFKGCAPPSGKCEGCFVTGCAGTEKCDFTKAPPACVALKAPCETCAIDSECQAGNRCVLINNGKVCAPDCAAASCPTGSSCQSFAGGVKACGYASATCCYSNCAADKPCGGACTADKCLAGKCVECNVDGDCTGGKCNVSTHTCTTNAACQAPKPIKMADGTCVECVNDTNCSGNPKGSKCDVTKHECTQQTTSSECDACKTNPNYPACVNVNGQWSCAQCATDAECKVGGKDLGTCNSTTYTCSATSSGTGGPTSGTCKTDADCGTGSGFTLLCDTKTGLCYDAAGGCDGVTAFCDAASGSKCISLMDMLGGGALPGGGGGIPGLPGGGLPGGGATAGGGYCTCDPGGGGGSGGTPCIFPGFPPGCSAGGSSGGGTGPGGACFGGIKCSDQSIVSLILQVLGGGSGGSGSSAPKGMCGDFKLF